MFIKNVLKIFVRKFEIYFVFVEQKIHERYNYYSNNAKLNKLK